MRHATGCWRLLRILGHILAGAWTAARLPRLRPPEQRAVIQTWALGFLAHAGIALEIRGQPPASGPLLLVCNHISWLDIPVLQAARHCRFVSKSELRNWPLVGTLATAAGTLYIERGSRRDTLRVAHLMAQGLEAQGVLAVFPEGTTGDGRALLPFHANLLQAAVATDSPAQPVGLRFVDKASGRVSHAPSYVGDETLLGSLWRTLCAPAIVAVVHFGKAERAEGRGRRAWCHDLRKTIDRLRQT